MPFRGDQPEACKITGRSKILPYMVRQGKPNSTKVAKKTYKFANYGQIDQSAMKSSKRVT